MRAGRRCSKLDVMEGEPRHLHVDLEFEVGSDPIRGRVAAHLKASRDFQGWIELAAALESVMSAPAEVEPQLGSAVCPANSS